MTTIPTHTIVTRAGSACLALDAAADLIEREDGGPRYTPETDEDLVAHMSECLAIAL